ncbi:MULTISPECIES: hypothetical protein [unclassified Bradyrhizobium]|uniref:hypothetical protein n=1 Tax=Bradyrhizobium sp. USDA 4541 TaxID=2817704 RepID=UPI0020A5CC5D|nr:hypothetical protein [Bradyrhizobium sp. USDA 4541]MCP1852820.1 hypothetical protein [Bradyrhizobium sp. USDA 4541]
MDFAAFQAAAAELDSRMKEAGARLGAVTESLAAEMGIPARGPMGLTPDRIKFDPRYRLAKAAADIAFAELRAFNGRYAPRFKKEIRAEIDARRRAKCTA